MRQLHRGRGGSRHVGRLRIAAAKILNKAFPELEVFPEDISPATGANRTNRMLDIHTWELFARYKGSETPVVGQSWQTLTEFVQCARNGGAVTMDADNYIWSMKPKGSPNE